MNLEEKMLNKNFSKIIISFAFFYSAFVCYFRALELFEAEQNILATFLIFCAFCSFCGALRFQIAKIIYKIRDYKNDR